MNLFRKNVVAGIYRALSFVRQSDLLFFMNMPAQRELPSTLDLFKITLLPGPSCLVDKSRRLEICLCQLLLLPPVTDRSRSLLFVLKSDFVALPRRLLVVRGIALGLTSRSFLDSEIFVPG